MRKILYIAPLPAGEVRIRTDKEFSRIQKALNGNIDIVAEFGAILGEIGDSILTHSPDILHFSGHGHSSGKLVFENEQGDVKLANVELLNKLFSSTFPSISVNCVVLNACHSIRLAEAIARYVDYVIGIRGAVDDGVAIEFSFNFYKALSSGVPLLEAFNYSCAALETKEMNVTSLVLMGRKVPLVVAPETGDMALKYIAELLNLVIPSENCKNVILQNIRRHKVPHRVDIFGVDCFDTYQLQLTLRFNTDRKIISYSSHFDDDLMIDFEEAATFFKNIVYGRSLFVIIKIDEDDDTIQSRWNEAERETTIIIEETDTPPYLTLSVTGTKE